MKYFYDVRFDKFKEWVRQADYPPYKAAQIYQWKAKGIYSFDDMSNIAIPMRAELSKDYYIDGLLIEEKLESSLDGTVKYVFRMKDGNLIESVLMEYRHGSSVCISSQAGCKMGCSFCVSSQAGFGRNLSSGEMIAQVSIISRDSGKRVSNVVVMGIGEPFDNYEQLILFLKETQAPDGLGIGMRHISVSTCGLVDEMLKFTEEGFPVTLSVSLHAPNDTIRMNLMPIAKRYPMNQLLEACRYYVKKTRRRITFEYALIRGINDQPIHAEELATKIKGILCHVNLIPVNEWESGPYKRSTIESIKIFQKILTDHRIHTTIRRELGTDIAAACGQLRLKKRKTGEGE